MKTLLTFAVLLGGLTICTDSNSACADEIQDRLNAARRAVHTADSATQGEVQTDSLAPEKNVEKQDDSKLDWYFQYRYWYSHPGFYPGYGYHPGSFHYQYRYFF